LNHFEPICFWREQGGDSFSTRSQLKQLPHLLLWLSIGCHHLSFAEEYTTFDGSDSVQWHPLERAICSPLVQNESNRDSTLHSMFDWSAYATGQYSPGARLQGNWVQLPTAGGLGWVTGLNVFGQHGKWNWEGNLDHWRVAGVREEDWNEAWQWGVWDGLGRAWNPNEADIAVLRSTGNINFQASPSVILSVGQESHHWGKGWRSLWLDRQAAPLPFVRLVVDLDRLNYTHMVARTQHRSLGSPPPTPTNGRTNPGSYVSRRGAWMAAHAIEVDLGRGWHGSLFGAVTWLNNDSGYTHRFETAYALPFIAFRPTEFALGSSDNALIGAALSWLPRSADDRLLIHSQVLFDELVVSEFVSGNGWWANKWGALGSVQWQSANRHWRIVAEGVAVRPFTYSHASKTQSWTHQHRPLAHPSGSNFVEGRLHLQWSNHLLKTRLGCVWMKKGVDSPTALGEVPSLSLGADPLIPYVSRPADYNVDLIWDGSGWIDEAGIQTTLRWWGDLAFSIPPLDGQEIFIRGFLRESYGIQATPNWWRIEIGLRVKNVLEERNW
jgi:hypothetical protein